MVHLPDLIRDLCFILVTAAIVTLLFRRLKQPVVLGYLIAGFLVGPHVPILPSVTDTESIKVWAEIGVIFLLFGLGLEFSFRRLAQVGKSASITATFEILFMLGVGYLLGQAFGWSKIDSLYLGGILSISSTTIIVRAVEELGLKARRFVGLVYGVLIVEDLAAILLLVLLSTVAATKSLSGADLSLTTLKLGFFLILWFVVGIYVVPLFLQKIRRLMTEETTLIVSIGLCLLMVLIATAVGFSPALGAFVMGSILAETRDGQTIEKIIHPVKNLFAAIFFVSVGMLIDPQIIFQNWWIVVVLSFATIFGKLISSALGALISGQSLRHSVQAGMSLAQIGEFSFIIATLGITLNVISEVLYPIAVAVSAVTTFTTPYQMKYADDFYGWVEKRLPPKFLGLLENYQSAVRSRSSGGLAFELWRLYGVKILLNSVLIIALTLLITRVGYPAAVSAFGEHLWVRLATSVLALLICAPFFWPVIFAQPSEESLRTVRDTKNIKYLQLGIVFLRLLLGVVLVGFIVSRFFSIAAVYGTMIIIFTLGLIFLAKYLQSFYGFFESRFLLNLHDKKNHEAKQNGESLPALAPWDATMSDFVLSQDSSLIGKKLVDSRIKEEFGVTLVLIERGSKRILAPGRDEILLPQDRLFFIGSEQQLDAIRKRVERVPDPITGQELHFFGLDHMVIGDGSQFKDKKIRDSGLREKVQGLIVGIERGSQRILSPDSALELKPGDIVWLVGDKSLIRSLKSSAL